MPREKDASHWRPGTTPGSRWTVDQMATDVHRIRIECSSREELCQRFLLSSDRHHDSTHCDQAMELRHLKEAQRQNGIILDFGDMHDAMNGKWDRRQSRDSMRPEYQHGDYLDRLVKVAAEFYKPFAANFGMIGVGNHETSIKQHHETDLTERTCAAMGAGLSFPVLKGSYTGWIVVCVTIGGCCFTLKMHYHHGAGGGGMMSHDVLRTRRDMSMIGDCDVYVSGHTHDQWNVTLAQKRLFSNRGIYESRVVPVEHCKCGGYKNETAGGNGWHNETGKPPKPVGQQWMKLYWKGTVRDGRLSVKFERAD